MTRYWVVGGEYADTSFTRIAGGGAEDRIGPFRSYDEAKAAWQERAWQTVDSAHHRYRIEEENGGTETHYWVVGGIYKDTRFAEPAEGGEQWYGPFDSYDDAKAEWQRRAWSSVDDALSRYRIEKRSGARPPEAG
ncbi:MAG: hypothetical protein BroJett029_42160 [Alphaproteobacteria bacterium]|nr:MAG: hypothetical protein BroJett029_42160 [Alphaproteobacteria bacterium]